MRNGLQRTPFWLQVVVRELMKPPYFLNPPTTPGGEEGTKPSASSQGSPHTQNYTDDNRAFESHSMAYPNSRPVNSREVQLGQNHVQPTVAKSLGKPTGKTKPQLNVVKGSAKARKDSSLTQRKPVIDDQTRAWQGIFRQANYPISLPALFGWEDIVRVQRVANILRVTTADGEYALKRTHIPPERVIFLQKALSHIANNDFTRFASFVPSVKNRPYVHLDGETFYATKWLHGQPANFTSVSQVGEVAKALAQFHEASREFAPPGYQPPSEFRLKRMLRERATDLRELLALAEQNGNPDEFDRLFRQLAPVLRKDAEQSLRLLDSESCQEFLARAESEPGLCHLDVIPNNFIYDQNRLAWLLDFDLSTYAPRVLDLSHLLRRSLQRTNWNTEIAYTCFLNFNSVQSMTREEYQIVQAFLTFPYQAWRIAQARYRLFLDIQQVHDLENYAAQETRRQGFLSAYAEQITRLDEAE